MTKLARVWLTEPYDHESDDKVLSSRRLDAGRDRKDPHGLAVVDLELDDDAERRRVWVRIPGRADQFIPYERIRRAEVAEQPKLAAVPRAKR